MREDITIHEIVREYSKSRRETNPLTKESLDMPIKCALCGIGIGTSRCRGTASEGKLAGWKTHQHVYKDACSLEIDGNTYTVDRDCLRWAENKDIKTVRLYLRALKSANPLG